MNFLVLLNRICMAFLPTSHKCPSQQAVMVKRSNALMHVWLRIRPGKDS